MSRSLFTFSLHCLRIVIPVALLAATWRRLIPSPQYVTAIDMFPWKHIRSGARAVLIGTLLALLSYWFLLELGYGTECYAVLSTITLCVTGLLLTIRAISHRQRLSALGRAIPLYILFGYGFLYLVMLSPCSEWLLGGWDPGVYLNQGISVAQTGSFHPGPETGLAMLTPDEMAPFSRGDDTYLECFPGVPLDPQTGRLIHYFFRLTPTLFAALAQYGGLHFAMCGNMIVGWLAAIVFCAALLTIAPKRPALALFSTLFLIAHPLFLYHLHIPVTEMLQLFLVCGIGLLIPSRSRSKTAPIALGLALFATLLNRVSFLPFAGIMVCGLALLDRTREDRVRVLYERGILLIAIAGGTFVDMHICAVTMVRLAHVTHKLAGTAAIAIGVALVIDTLALLIPAIRMTKLHVPCWLRRTVVPFILLGILSVYLLKNAPFLGRLPSALHGILPYMGAWLVAVGGLGAIHLFWNPSSTKGLLRPYVVYLFLVASIIAVGGFIAPLYPWATRRHLVYAVPLVCILAGHLVSVVWRIRRVRWLGPCLAVALLVALLGANAKRSWHAWNRTEYNGLSTTLSEIADQIADDDIVVCDHPWWATPLALTYGKKVLNAKEFYSDKSGNAMRKGMATLQRLAGEGKRIRFLTSTRTAALSVYPLPVEPVVLDWDSGELGFMEFIHHKKADDFEMKERRQRFRLYTWHP